MNRVKRSLVLASLWWSIPSGTAPSFGAEPLELVRSVSERVIEILKEPALKAPERQAERGERVRALVNPVFDYEEMARRTLGNHWRRRSAAEQQEFIKLFRAFLEKIYTDKISLYAGERVVFGGESMDREFAEVESKLVGPKGETSTVVYRLKRADGGWKIYDAVVENISIVNNYRSQFDRVIGKSSYAELTKMLRDKGA